jgi:hypothetical protein
MAFGVGIVIGIPTFTFPLPALNVGYVPWGLKTLSFEPRIAPHQDGPPLSIVSSPHVGRHCETASTRVARSASHAGFDRPN